MAIITRVSPSGTNALVELLTSLFTTDELYRFAAFLPGHLRAVLPGGTASLHEVAFGLVDALERRGLIDDGLFARRRGHAGIQSWADPAIVGAGLAAQIERHFPEQRDAEVDPVQRLEQQLQRVSPCASWPRLTGRRPVGNLIDGNAVVP